MFSKKTIYILFVLLQICFSSSEILGQIQFSISYGEIVDKYNGVETLNSAWEYATVNFILDNDNSKFKVHYYERTPDTTIERSSVVYEQSSKWDTLSSNGIIFNKSFIKNPNNNKLYVLVFGNGTTNSAYFFIYELDSEAKNLTGKYRILRNAGTTESDHLMFLSSDGLSLFRYDVDFSNVFYSKSYNLARNESRDSIKLLYTSPGEVFQKNKKDYLQITFPPRSFNSTLLHRDISRNLTFKDGIYTYKNDSIDSESSGYGFFSGSNTGFDKFTYSWFVPGNIEIISYKCNRPGKWNKDINSITFYGDKGINNVLFEISYKIKNVAAKEIEKTSIALKEKISIPNKKTKVSIWDNNVEDGDIISLSLNGEWIVRNLEVKKCQTSFYLNLDPGENFLVMKAENTGSTPPNTAAFLIETDGFSKEIILNSDMGKSEMIQIDVK